MGRLYVNQTLERQIRQYCELNEIDDINAFANRCLSQGFSIIKFGTSPRDNVEREINGIKDIKKNETRKKKEPKPSREEESKRRVEETVKEPAKKENMEEKEEIKEVKTPVTVRKIQIIKKS
jgi:hypothetical protein